MLLFSGGRSISRKQAHRCFLLGLAISSGASTWLLADGPPAYPSLSGTWTGTYSWLQRGSCSLGGSSRLFAQVQVTVNVDPTGAFEAKVISVRVIGDPRRVDAYAQFPVEGDPGFGQFKPDLTFQLKVPVRTRCGGALRQFETEYAGQVTDKNGELKMAFSGDVVPCIEVPKCRFKGSVSLKKK